MYLLKGVPQFISSFIELHANGYATGLSSPGVSLDGYLIDDMLDGSRGKPVLCPCHFGRSAQQCTMALCPRFYP